MTRPSISWFIAAAVVLLAMAATAQEQSTSGPTSRPDDAEKTTDHATVESEPSGEAQQADAEEAAKDKAAKDETEKASSEHGADPSAKDHSDRQKKTSHPAPQQTVSDAKGAEAFQQVYSVLMSPRCMNCHPVGDRPLQTDDSRPHRMNVSRTSFESGMKCATCHREQNSEAVGVEGGPPGAPNWHLPPEDTPMIFENRSPRELCLQLKDPEMNGEKTLADLLHHVSEDALVLWGWDPGGDRTTPPLSHQEFVSAFKTWVDSRGACP